MYKSLYRDEVIYHYKELAQWETNLPEAKHLTGPPFEQHSNPSIVGNVLIVTSFSPGFAFGLDKRTGKRLWKVDLKGYGMPCGSYRNLAYASSSTALFCIDPKTGKVLWRFQPLSGDREEMYSTPAFANDDLFIGDRSGRLHCLNAATGKLNWSVPTGHGQLNSTPLVFKDRLAVVNNADRLSVFSIKDGKEFWHKNTPRASIFRPIHHRSKLLCHDGGTSLMAISEGGKNYVPSYLKTTKIATVLSDKNFIWVLDKTIGSEDTRGKSRLLQFRDRKLVNAISMPEHTSHISFLPDRKSILLNHFQGFLIYSIPKNEVTTYISWEYGRDPLPSLPAYENKKLYVATLDSTLVCLRVP